MSGGLTDIGFWRRVMGRMSGLARIADGERAAPFDSYTSPAGSSVSPETALKLSAVWACVGLRSATISSLPLHLRDANKKLATEEPLYRLLHDAPNADMTSSEWLETQSASVDLWGNGYSRIERDRGRPIALTPEAPDRVTVRRRSDGRLVYEVRRKGREEEVDEDDMLHLRGFTLDGLLGLSPVQFAAESLGGLLDANRAAAREWQNGMQHGGIIGTPQLTDDQRARFRKHLREHQGPENAGRSMLLEEPFKVIDGKSLRINPVDAQLLQSRYFGIEEICRAFRVPPSLIGHTDKASSWASSLENTNLGFLTYSLRPTLVRIEQAMARKLMTPEQRLKYQIKFSVEGLLRADSAGRSAFYSQMLQNGVFSRNYVRGLEDLPPVEGGDALTVQLNLTTLDQIGKAPEPAAAVKRTLREWLLEGSES